MDKTVRKSPRKAALGAIEEAASENEDIVGSKNKHDHNSSDEDEDDDEEEADDDDEEDTEDTEEENDSEEDDDPEATQSPRNSQQQQAACAPEAAQSRNMSPPDKDPKNNAYLKTPDVIPFIQEDEMDIFNRNLNPNNSNNAEFRPKHINEYRVGDLIMACWFFQYQKKARKEAEDNDGINVYIVGKILSLDDEWITARWNADLLAAFPTLMPYEAIEKKRIADDPGFETVYPAVAKFTLAKQTPSIQKKALISDPESARATAQLVSRSYAKETYINVYVESLTRMLQFPVSREELNQLKEPDQLTDATHDMIVMHIEQANKILKNKDKKCKVPSQSANKSKAASRVQMLYAFCIPMADHLNQLKSKIDPVEKIVKALQAKTQHEAKHPDAIAVAQAQGITGVITYVNPGDKKKCGLTACAQVLSKDKMNREALLNKKADMVKLLKRNLNKIEAHCNQSNTTIVNILGMSKEQFLKEINTAGEPLSMQIFAVLTWNTDTTVFLVMVDNYLNGAKSAHCISPTQLPGDPMQKSKNVFVALQDEHYNVLAVPDKNGDPQHICPNDDLDRTFSIHVLNLEDKEQKRKQHTDNTWTLVTPKKLSPSRTERDKESNEARNSAPTCNKDTGNLNSPDASQPKETSKKGLYRYNKDETALVVKGNISRKDLQDLLRAKLQHNNFSVMPTQKGDTIFVHAHKRDHKSLHQLIKKGDDWSIKGYHYGRNRSSQNIPAPSSDSIFYKLGYTSAPNKPPHHRSRERRPRSPEYDHQSKDRPFPDSPNRGETQYRYHGEYSPKRSHSYSPNGRDRHYNPDERYPHMGFNYSRYDNAPNVYHRRQDPRGQDY